MHRPPSIAVLMTCHNRAEHTVKCIDSVKELTFREPCSITIYLVDDGSSDGTSSAVLTRHPTVHLINGDGSLYWNGGMRVAFAAAMQNEPDFLLFLNDDTRLCANAIQKLLDTYRLLQAHQPSPEVIVVGATADQKGEISYGGWTVRSKWLKLKIRRLRCADEAQRCDTFNGNCVLIPSAVATSVGNLDAAFSHGMGDFDYGFRAAAKGFQAWVAAGTVGNCEPNLASKPWYKMDLPIRDRWRAMNGPKGIPFKEWFVFASRHGGRLWIISWMNPYLKFLLFTMMSALHRHRYR